jgi:hypothetical protein
MSDIAKRDFEMLTVDGSNYLTWATDVEIKLDGMSLDHTIVEPEADKDERTKPDKAKALHYLQHHIHPDLKCEYMTEKDPLVLWQSLKDRFSQQLMIVLPEHNRTRSIYASKTLSLWQRTTPLCTGLRPNCVYVAKRSLMLI